MREPEEAADWRVRIWASAFREVARAHLRLVPHLATHPGAASGAMLELTEELYAAFESAGMSPTQIVGLVGVVVDYLNGFALAEASGALGGPDEHRQAIEMLGARPLGELPAIRRTLEAVDGENLGTGFEVGLGVVLAGLEAAIDHPQTLFDLCWVSTPGAGGAPWCVVPRTTIRCTRNTSI